MKKHNKRITAAILLISMVLPLFAACTDDTKDNAGQEEEANIAGFPTDGWEYGSPEKHGINKAALRELEKRMADDVLSGRSQGASIAIARNGYLVYENNEGYFAASPVFPARLRALTIAVVSALIGIAIEEGHIGSADDRVLDYFGGWDIGNIDEMKEAMTIRDVLTMRSGLSWDGGEDEYWAEEVIKGIENPVLELLSAPMEARPGTVRRQNIAAVSILTALIQEAVGMGALEYAWEKLFDPMGITEVEWVADGQGVNYGGFGLRVSVRDMLKLGYLHLRNGEWDGEQVIPAKWVAESVAGGYHWEAVDEGVVAGEQLIETTAFSARLREAVEVGEMYRASGYGGQYVYVWPKYDMVVAMANFFAEGYMPEGDYGNNVVLADVLASVADAVEYIQNESAAQMAAPFGMPEATGELVIYKYQMPYNTIFDAAVKAYEREYPEVEVKVVEFGDEYYDILRTEVAAGKGPDVWLGNYFEFADIYKTANSGAFEDLAEYMKNDGTDWSLYNKPVLDGGIYKGKQYFLPISYQVNVLMTTEEIMQEEQIDLGSIKTASDFMKTIRKLQKKYPAQETPLFRQTTDSQDVDSYMNNYFPWSGIALLDYETGNIAGDSEILRDIVDAMKWAHKSVDDTEDTAENHREGFSVFNPIAGLREKERIFTRIGRFTIDTTVHHYSLLLSSCSPLLMAFPDIDGKITAMADLLGAVFKNSKNKLNAYNFLKILLSETIQTSTTVYEITTPVLKSAVRTLVDKASDMLSSFKSTAPIPSDTLEAIVDMFTNVDRCFIPSREPESFFYEHFMPYLDNKKTYEQCFAAFKNDLELYYSE